MSLRIYTEPTEEIVSIEDARLHLRLDGEGSSNGHPDDTLIDAMLGAAREWAELYLARSIAQKTYELALDSFPSDEIELLMPPIQSITSVQYVDTAGALQTLAADQYSLDKKTEPGWLFPADGTEWPETAEVVNAVTIRYVAGYSPPNDSEQAYPLPKSLRAGVLLLLHDLYENRGNAGDKVINAGASTEVPFAAQMVMGFKRLGMGV